MGKLLTLYENQKRVDPITPKHHGLNGQLIVSMTSYAPRFKWLHLTIKSLLEQTIIPDALVLWIAEEELNLLPDSVRALSKKIVIEPTKNLYSYKKIIPALRAYHQAHIVICDDDIYYPRGWLEGLVCGFGNFKRAVFAHSVHRFHYSPSGQIAPYYDWSFDVQDNKARQRSFDTLAVGVGGVLYPHGSLHPDVTDESLFTSLCPGGDDLWLYVMARLNGFLPVKVGNRLHPIFWPGTQSVGLFKENMYKNDDIAIAKLMAHYGKEIFNPAVDVEDGKQGAGSEVSLRFHAGTPS
ncbi:glycosyltransferase family 2 protein [Dyella thiooxydans]|uniref:glycosyltransferase family 2 protein n=1 Tax=Dyella thiooxydans TaxID=445710 RepID=UPI0012FAE534|nr:glycosyltransferase family 2 protein [Dyella thiooxydans]